MIFEANGALAPGFHDCTYNEFLSTFVENFPTSQRRLLIAKSLVDFSKEIYSIDIPYEFWVDGSYATTKVNPNDADIILFFQHQHIDKIMTLWPVLREKYAGVLDIYFGYAISPENKCAYSPQDYLQIVNMRNYWRGQFGFDREDRPKGIIRLNCKSIAEQLDGR